MPEPPAATVNHYKNLILQKDAESACRILIKYIVLPRDLYLKKMVAGAKCPYLVLPPIPCLLRYRTGISALDGTVFLNILQILFHPITVFNRPSRTLYHCLVQRILAQSQHPLGTNPRRHPAEQGIDEIPQFRFNLLQGKGCGNQANAAVNIKTDSSGRDYPPIGIDCGNPPYRKSVP